MNWKLFFFVVLPLLANLALAVGGYMFRTSLADSPGTCYFVAMTGAIASFVGIGGLALHDIGRVNAIMSLFAQAITLITIFAMIYHGFGLGEPRTDADIITAVYFSIVTWTTLGYGDVHPPGSLRILAAMEAALGYLYLGLIVGLIGSLLSRQDRI